MVVCVGGVGSGKTLLLKLLADRAFDPDSLLVPTVGVNIYSLALRSGKRKVSVSIRELGGELAPLWGEYLKTETCLIFVVDTQNLGQVGLVAVKLCECLAQLERNSISFNQVARVCLVWTKQGSVKTLTKLLRLKELLHNSPVILTEISFNPFTLSGIPELEQWLISTQAC